jgi:hypothetical protein
MISCSGQAEINPFTPVIKSRGVFLDANLVVASSIQIVFIRQNKNHSESVIILINNIIGRRSTVRRSRSLFIPIGESLMIKKTG